MITPIREDAIVKPKFTANLSKLLAQKNNQQGLTLFEGLVVIVILMIIAGVTLPILFSQDSYPGPKETIRRKAINNIRALNRAQQAYYLERQKFADSFDQLKLRIPNINDYKYSMQNIGLATFQYATTLNPERKSYLGIVFPISNPLDPDETSEIFIKAILCEQNQPGIRPSEPIFKDGLIQCAQDQKEINMAQ